MVSVSPWCYFLFCAAIEPSVSFIEFFGVLFACLIYPVEAISVKRRTAYLHRRGRLPQSSRYPHV